MACFLSALAPCSAHMASAQPFHKQTLSLKKEVSGTSRKDTLGKGQCSNYYPVPQKYRFAPKAPLRAFRLKRLSLSPSFCSFATHREEKAERDEKQTQWRSLMLGTVLEASSFSTKLSITLECRRGEMLGTLVDTIGSYKAVRRSRPAE